VKHGRYYRLLEREDRLFSKRSGGMIARLRDKMEISVYIVYAFRRNESGLWAGPGLLIVCGAGRIHLSV
jgi:hypothetical protein